MKRIIYKIYMLAMVACVAFLSAACSDDHADLQLTDQVKVLSFKANEIKGDINEAKGTISIVAPWSQNLQAMKTEITTSEGAIVTPANENNADLSGGKKYRVTNRNVYNDYVVTAVYPKILTFSIGKYQGKINHTDGTITVKFPRDEDVTSLKPVYTQTSGATVTPEPGKTIDFTNPVVYKISFMGETFDYTVTVIPTNFEPVAFVGASASAGQIANADEKAAYEWFSENMPINDYVSFVDIKDGKVTLSKYKAIWWHCDTDASDLPYIANDPKVIERMQSYYNSGGSFFFSSWAVQYVATLEIPLNKEKVNNMWGQGNNPFIVGEDWGICFTGNETHPIFDGLQKPSGVNNKAYLAGAGVKAKGHNAIWSFDGWTAYPGNPAGWAVANGAKSLASFYWDDNLAERSVLFEYPTDGTKGKVICIGCEGYDWYNEDGSIPNAYKANIETLTSNILDYLTK